MKLNKSELNKILEETEKELSALLQTESEKLNKAQPGKETSAEEQPDVSSTSPSLPESSGSKSGSSEASASGSDSGKAPEMAPEGSSDGSKSGSESGSSSESGSGSGSKSGSGFGGDMEGSSSGSSDGSKSGSSDDSGVDVAQLQAELEQEPIERLKVLHLAVKGAIMAKIGTDPDQAATPMAPPAPVATPPAAPPQDNLAMKKEVSSEASANGGKIEGGKAFGKSEAETKEVEDLKKKVSEQDEVVNQLLKAVNLMIERPERKAITGVSFITKGQEEKVSPVASLTKSEIQDKLCAVASSPDLKKSDRELINSYCVGAVGLGKIEHLLK
jgi:hypothetical protein